MIKSLTGIRDLVEELDERYTELIENEAGPSEYEMEFNQLRDIKHPMWVPHDKDYQTILDELGEEDVVCDMGAGDFRFALMASSRVKKIYAIEVNPQIVSDALRIIGYRLPRNIIPICCAWQDFPVPEEVTVITFMINHADIIPIWVYKRILIGRQGEVIIDDDSRMVELYRQWGPERFMNMTKSESDPDADEYVRKRMARLEDHEQAIMEDKCETCCGDTIIYGGSLGCVACPECDEVD